MRIALVVFPGLAGMLSWSLLEYVLHRWLGHDRRFIRNPFGDEHTAHHSRGNYFAPAWKKLLTALLLFPTLAVFTCLAVGRTAGLVWAASLVGTYLAYELFHYQLHVLPGFTPFGRWARRHHFHHHFHDPASNHGVTSPIWDFVFGTRAVPGRILVPRKLAMRWLIDPATGDVRAEYAAQYGLKGGNQGL